MLFDRPKPTSGCSANGEEEEEEEKGGGGEEEEEEEEEEFNFLVYYCALFTFCKK
jgi:hypothetical protein